MQQYQNTDVVARRWDTLVDLDTGRTLALDAGAVTKAGVGRWAPRDGAAPGSEALDTEFSSEFLVPVAAPTVASSPTKSSSTKGATQTDAEATADADTPKE